jgi:hypothetical protein
MRETWRRLRTFCAAASRKHAQPFVRVEAFRLGEFIRDGVSVPTYDS